MSTYEISKSSILSLKAEILRKQEEVSKIKLENKDKPVPKKANPLDLKNDKKKANQCNNPNREYNSEDEDLIRKSRSQLEAKAKLYDKLVKSGNSNDGEPNRYLVCFDKKASNVAPYIESSSEDETINDNYEPAENSDEEWVEYTDCLGRSRQCLRKDLKHIQANDAELKHTVQEKPLNEANSIEKQVAPDNEDKIIEQESELMSSDMRREELRKQWEKEEEENAKKDNVHYQDVLFSEARSHGVGYYGFSKDEETRAQQQEALRILRQETEEHQKKAQDLRAMREKQMAIRAKAAKNRKRIRMGLPPEEDEIEATPTTKAVVPEENMEEQQTAEERQKKEARKRHIRPWDIGKDGLKKEFYEYSQKEWVEKQRKERVAEFAPPTIYSNERPFTSEHRKEEKTQKRKSAKSPEKESSNDDEDDSLMSDYKFISKQSTISKPTTSESRKPKAAMQPTRIVNELFSDEELPTTSLVNPYKNYAAIPPPSNLENGQSSTKPKKAKMDTADSIMAGLQYLRKQAEKKKNSSGHDREMFIM